MLPDADKKALQKIWYQKLKEEGFEDIENNERPGTPLNAWHSLKWRYIPQERMEETMLYYAQAKELLYTFHFENTAQKRIWELHSEGLSKREIEKALAKTKTPFKREWIGVIINKIAEFIK